MANPLFEVLRKTKILNGIRVKPNTSRSHEGSIDPDEELTAALLDPDGSLNYIDGISKFRELSTNRNDQYNAFDMMEKDSIISSALKMYADDATQYNLNGEVVWVESDDPNIADFGNRLIQVLRINEKAWTHIYNLVKYGDLYLETFYDDEIDSSMQEHNVKSAYGLTAHTHKIGSRITEYVEMVNNPAEIFELQRWGKTQGFIKINGDSVNQTNASRMFSVKLTGTNQQILPSDKYVHIMIGQEAERFPETLEIQYKSSAEDDKPSSTIYNVAKGKSILEDVFKSYRELKLMEDSILLNRVTRSAITRILQVEVGDMPKPQVREKLRKIKMMIEQKNFMDKNEGIFANQSSPGPLDNTIYIPTRAGVGAITSTSIGGDVDPKTLIDVEYYQQKLAGGLLIPLSYIRGQSGDGGGLSSGTALTKLDNRYARTIKRVQTAYTQGITNLINIFAIRKGLLDYVNAFRVRMLSPSTIEDNDRDEQLSNRVDVLGNILNLIESDDMYSKETYKEVISTMMSSYLNKPEISKILESNGKEEDSIEDANTDESTHIPEDSDVDNSIPTSFETAMSAATESEPEASEPLESFGSYEEFA